MFPKYFNTTNVSSYVKQPVKIASRTYANRMGNGDEASQEGYKYRGRGYIQLTGKDNYSKFGKAVQKSLEETVTHCETVGGAIESACWFWKSRNLNAIADAGSVTAMTKKVNGGVNGLSERQSLYTTAIDAIVPA